MQTSSLGLWALKARQRLICFLTAAYPFGFFVELGMPLYICTCTSLRRLATALQDYIHEDRMQTAIIDVYGGLGSGFETLVLSDLIASDDGNCTHHVHS